MRPSYVRIRNPGGGGGHLQRVGSDKRRLGWKLAPVSRWIRSQRPRTHLSATAHARKRKQALLAIAQALMAPMCAGTTAAEYMRETINPQPRAPRCLRICCSSNMASTGKNKCGVPEFRSCLRLGSRRAPRVPVGLGWPPPHVPEKTATPQHRHT